MEFFDKLGKKASETYKVTAEKTSKLARTTKLKMRIGELKSNVSDLYEEIGKKVFENYELGKKTIDFEKDLLEEIKQLKETTDEIAKINEERLTLKDKKRCPKCDKEIDEDVSFCPYCGAKQETKKVEVVEEEKDKESHDDKNKVEVKDNKEDKEEIGKKKDNKEHKNVAEKKTDKEENKEHKREDKDKKTDKEKNKEHIKEDTSKKAEKEENKKAEKSGKELEKTVKVESNVKEQKK